MTRAPVGRLHVIVSSATQARCAAAAGAHVVQYREKRELAYVERLALARAVHEACAQHAVACIVNDDPQLALDCAAAGVHVGADDPSPGAARATVGPTRWVGVTANTLEQALAGSREKPDYLGVGPVFATRSKHQPAAVLGLDQLERIVRAVDVPVIAIGGIDLENCESVLARGPWGIAVLSAVTQADDPTAATQRFRVAVDRCSPRQVWV